MMRYLLVIATVAFSNMLIAQTKVGLDTIQPYEPYDNLLVKTLSSDQYQSCFLIWVKKSVREHKHLKHTESIYFLEGSCEMKINGKTMALKKGDFLIIPVGVPHSVERVTSDVPIKVLSSQAPEFKGDDRVIIQEY